MRAKDQAEAMKVLGISKADIMGVSQGGMIAQYLAIVNSCIHHSAYNELDKIECPTLIVGGDSDKIVEPNSSVEIAERIRSSKLFIYNGLGHAVYEEAKDFNDRVLDFLVR